MADYLFIILFLSVPVTGYLLNRWWLDRPVPLKRFDSLPVSSDPIRVRSDHDLVDLKLFAVKAATAMGKFEPAGVVGDVIYLNRPPLGTFRLTFAALDGGSTLSIVGVRKRQLISVKYLEAELGHAVENALTRSPKSGYPRP